jgi:uncharacterized protein (TIGR02246 family)
MKTMNRMLLGAAALALCLPAQAQTAGTAASEDAIRKLSADFAAAWAKDDTKAMAALWAPDGDLINPWLRVAKGPAEIEKLFEEEHSTLFKGTSYGLKVSGVRFLGADVAIADWESTITGMKGSGGNVVPPMPPHHVTLVLQRKAGKWWIVAARPVIAPPPPPGPPPGK